MRTPVNMTMPVNNTSGAFIPSMPTWYEIPNCGNHAYLSTNWYPAALMSYEKYAQIDKPRAMVAAARAATRTSDLRLAGINKSSSPQMIGVNTITLKIGNCISQLLDDSLLEAYA
jgi:hypothetical protein